MRVFLFAVALVLAVLGCSDGKLNLLLVFWGDHDDPSSSSRIPPEPNSSSIIVIPSSSSEYEPPPPSSSSSEEEVLPSSSSEVIPSSSSSSEVPSSSSRGPRSSSAKTDDNGYTYPDYPPLEPGAPGVMKSDLVTRYYDGCKPSCSWLVQSGYDPKNKNSRWNLAKSCDRSGVKEIPAFYMSPADYNPPWHIGYLGTPNACVQDNRTKEWPKSTTYKDWKLKNPSFPGGEAHTCFDQVPYAVNDTLAYAFAASGVGSCGECYRLQFTGEWSNDEARPTHKALKGKTLIVMVNNAGVGDGAFDLMFPGGGLGDYDAFSVQLGLSPESNLQNTGLLGYRVGGLITECEQNNLGSGWRASLEEWQECLRSKCRRTFGNQHPDLLRGCLWSADWFMAANNPQVNYVKMPDCPQYLKDRYGSTIDTELPKPPEGHTGSFCVDGYCY